MELTVLVRPPRGALPLCFLDGTLLLCPLEGRDTEYVKGAIEGGGLVLIPFTHLYEIPDPINHPLTNLAPQSHSFQYDQLGD